MSQPAYSSRSWTARLRHGEEHPKCFIAVPDSIEPVSTPLAPPVVRYPPQALTVTGIVYCTMWMFMGIAASHSQANLLVAIFGLMVGMVMLTWGMGWRILGRVSVRRILPDHGIVGQSLTIQYEIANRKRLWPAMAVTLAELEGVEAFSRQPRAFVLHVAPRGSTAALCEAMPRRRGVHQLHRFQLSSSFPFGFIRHAAIRGVKESLLIYPAIAEVDPQLVRMCRPAESAGSRMRPLRGGTDEFYGVKEYQHGENPRWIYWRRSARTGTLVTKEMSHVSPPRLFLLVDTYVRANTVDEARADVERAIAMAASLASAALEQGLPVGIVAWSGHDWLTIAPNRGKRQRRDVLTALARLPANSACDQAALLAEAHRQQHSSGDGAGHGSTTTVLFTASPARQSLAERARGSGLVLSSHASSGARRWFQFANTVDFASCGPQEMKAMGRGQRAE
jgi:uncharacterized protein (DUF58 family)